MSSPEEYTATYTHNGTPWSSKNKRTIVTHINTDESINVTLNFKNSECFQLPKALKQAKPNDVVFKDAP